MKLGYRKVSTEMGKGSQSIGKTKSEWANSVEKWDKNPNYPHIKWNCVNVNGYWNDNSVLGDIRSCSVLTVECELSDVYYVMYLYFDMLVTFSVAVSLYLSDGNVERERERERDKCCNTRRENSEATIMTILLLSLNWNSTNFGNKYLPVLL